MTRPAQASGLVSQGEHLCSPVLSMFPGRVGLRNMFSLRGHVNKKNNSKKTLEVGGWVKCPIGNLKKLENIFLYIILIRFWGENLNVNNVINALLCLCSCFYVHVFVVNYF